MPELCEVEIYRRAARPLEGRQVVAVRAHDGYVLGTGSAELARPLVGATLGRPARLGKVLMVPFLGPHGRGDLGLRFGMTGRLVVDGAPAITELVYGERGQHRRHDRFVLELDVGELRVRDARRLGGVELDPDLSPLGPDALDGDLSALGSQLGATRAALKSFLLDQRRVAGLGNLLADEVLFRCGLAPNRRGVELGEEQASRLVASITPTVRDLLERGGSHLGDLMPRRPGGCCPLDGEPLIRDRIGGRTAYWCPRHQR